MVKETDFGVPDDENQEWTEEDFARARPFKEVFPKQYKAWRKKMGRPPVDSPKVHISLRLASDVVDGIRGTGPGYNARVEKLLRDSLARGELNSRQNLATAAGDEMAAGHLESRKEHIVERLGQLDTERTHLADQLDELEITERILLRFGGKADTTKRRSTRTTSPASGRRSMSLSDATLQAVKAHPQGASANEILTHLSREFGMAIRPNHLGIALQRHRRAGRLENRDQHWSVPAVVD
jgi:uncharacterized protein (DUF4415 family)